MAKPKFYVVWKGAEPGIYKSWDECSRQIKGFTGALYKSFATTEEAEEAYTHNPWSHIGSAAKKSDPSTKKKNLSPVISVSLCVDAAWNTESKVMEYRGVHMPTRKVVFHKGPFYDATNNIGEFLAIVHGLSLLHKQNSKIPVYSDSHTAIVWVRNKHAKTKLEKTILNEDLFNLIERAERWLFNNNYDNPVLKWETTEWGEIPADFGRK